jgi:trehalose 6-phosphate phosphatase
MAMTLRHLFSPDGEAALAATMARRPLLAFDFDGTLAPIVARPDDARVPLPVARRLDRLGARLPIAIVSGRRIDDVRGRLSFEPRWIIGNHGAENPLLEAEPAGPVLDGMRARLAAQADALAAAGVMVEDKQHSLALHYRLARAREAALQLIERLVADPGPGVDTYGGKFVVNVVAAGAPDKAGAVATLVERSGATSAVFLGDDVNDEPVFARAEPSWLTVKVGREDPNTRARFCLDGPAEVASMLDRMLVLLDAIEPS